MGPYRAIIARYFLRELAAPAIPSRSNFGSGQEVCFCPSRPDPVRNAQEQDGTRTGQDGPHLGTWMGPKHCKTKHMANLDGTTSDPGWDLDGPRIGPRRGSGWHPPRDSNRLLGLSENYLVSHSNFCAIPLLAINRGMIVRQPTNYVDDHQITHLICVRLKLCDMTFGGGCFRPPSCCFLI